MHIKPRAPWMLAAIFCLVSTMQANAQGVAPQIRSLQEHINVELHNGVLNQAQVNDLFARINLIQNENARLMNLNGGNLTPGQAARLESELNSIGGYHHFDGSHGAMWNNVQSARVHDHNWAHNNPNVVPAQMPPADRHLHQDQWHDHHDHHDHPDHP